MKEKMCSAEGVKLAGKAEALGEKPVPEPLCPSQILHGLATSW